MASKMALKFGLCVAALLVAALTLSTTAVSAAQAPPQDIIDFDNRTADLTVSLNSGDFVWTVQDSIFRTLTVVLTGSISNYSISIHNSACYNAPDENPCITIVFSADSVSGGVIDIREVGSSSNGTFVNIAIVGTSVLDTNITIHKCHHLVSLPRTSLISFSIVNNGGFGNKNSPSNLTISDITANSFDATQASTIFIFSPQAGSRVEGATIFVTNVVALPPATAVSNPKNLNIVGSFFGGLKGAQFIVDRVTDVDVFLLEGPVEDSTIAFTNCASRNVATTIGFMVPALDSTIVVDSGNFAASVSIILGNASAPYGTKTFNNVAVNITNSIAGGDGLQIYPYSDLATSRVSILNNTGPSIVGGNFQFVSQSFFTVRNNTATSFQFTGVNFNAAATTSTASVLDISYNQLVQLTVDQMNTDFGFVQIKSNYYRNAYLLHALLTLSGSGVLSVLDNNDVLPDVTLGDFSGVYELWSSADYTTTTQINGKVVPKRLQYSLQSDPVVITANFSLIARDDLLKVIQFGCATVYTTNLGDSTRTQITPAPVSCVEGNTMMRCTEGFWFYNQPSEDRAEFVLNTNVQSCMEPQQNGPTTKAPETQGPDTAMYIILPVAGSCVAVVFIGFAIATIMGKRRGAAGYSRFADSNLQERMA